MGYELIVMVHLIDFMECIEIYWENLTWGGGEGED